MIYKGYTIRRTKYQGLTAYTVTTPTETTWAELATSIQIAKRWIDTQIQETMERSYPTTCGR